jgi:hypothetical protein
MTKVKFIRPDGSTIVLSLGNNREIIVRMLFERYGYLLTN